MGGQLQEGCPQDAPGEEGLAGGGDPGLAGVVDPAGVDQPQLEGGHGQHVDDLGGEHEETQQGQGGGQVHNLECGRVF